MAYCSHSHVLSSSNDNTQCKMKLVHLRMRGSTPTYDVVAAAVLLLLPLRVEQYDLANDWLMNSLWKLVRLCMMSTSNVTWMQYMTYCFPLQLVLLDELSLLVRVLLCLFLSWQATRKVVQCWTKHLTYCCAEHQQFRLKTPWPQVPQESKRLPYCGASALGSTLWCDMIAAQRNHEHLGTMHTKNIYKIVCTCLWRWFLLVCLLAGPVAYAWLASWVYCWIYLMNGCIITERSKALLG